MTAAEQAEEIQMHRGWTVVLNREINKWRVSNWTDDNEWTKEGIYPVPGIPGELVWNDRPSTALIVADTWYKANVEKKP